MRWAQSRQLLVVCKSPGARPRKSHGFTGGRRVTGAGVCACLSWEERVAAGLGCGVRVWAQKSLCCLVSAARLDIYAPRQVARA
jgi:hypothetical protein